MAWKQRFWFCELLRFTELQKRYSAHWLTCCSFWLESSSKHTPYINKLWRLSSNRWCTSHDVLIKIINLIFVRPILAFHRFKRNTSKAFWSALCLSNPTNLAMLGSILSDSFISILVDTLDHNTQNRIQKILLVTFLETMAHDKRSSSPIFLKLRAYGTH